jgi:uncharacterized phage protein (TIGR02220 family)
MNKPPAFLFYPSDFEMGTSTWGVEEVGTYIRLLNTEWTSGPLPNDISKLAKIARVTADAMRSLWQTVGEKFVSDGNGKLINPRMEEERKKQEINREKRTNAGLVGAHARWDSSKGDGKRNADAMANGKQNDGFSFSSSFSSSKDKNINNTLSASPTVHSIVEHLNQKTDQHYKPTTPKTKKLIETRLKEGFSESDFITVIDKMAVEWGRGDMAKYLRPETLFGTKFESYLNRGSPRPSSAWDDTP